MATLVLPVFLEQEIARYGHGRSLDDILAEALVNHGWDSEKYEPHQQLHNPDEALADLLRNSSRSRDQIVQDALIEWISDYQAAEQAVKEERAGQKDSPSTISLEDWIATRGLDH